MKIQDAIDMLTEAKAKGVKNIVHAFWTADCFAQSTVSLRMIKIGKV